MNGHRPTAAPTRAIAAIALASVVLSACSGGADDATPAARADEPATTTSTTAAPTTTTTDAPTTTTTAKPVPAGLARGSKGPEVRALEERLAAQRFDVGIVDGTFDAMTGHGVMAFQKVHSLPRTGRATQDVLDKLAVSGPPEPLLPGGGPDRVEIDLKKQVLLLYRGGSLLRVVNASTGNGKRYCVEGECDVAVTPGGSFKATRKIKGLRVSRLGKLYDPVYFNGGIAIHGSPSVPAHPASHGCVRVPMPISRWIHDQIAVGMPIYVLGGKRAAVPFDEKAPGEGDTGATTTTSTTAAPRPTTSTTAAPATTTTAPAPAPTTTTTAPSP